MITANDIMIHLNERELSTIAPELATSLIAAICPNQAGGLVTIQDIQFTPSENSAGWFFECHHCQAANCTGFLRSD